MQHTRDAAFGMLNNPTQGRSGSDIKQVEVPNIDCGLIANSTQHPQQPFQCATALVGDTRLNVATHYSTALNLDYQQRSSYNSTEVMALSIDDSAREDTETNHDSKSNIRLDCSSQETMKLSSIPNSLLFSSNRDVGTPPSSNISNDPFNVSGFAVEKGIHNVANNLANSSTIESRNFTLSPETTDCDSADLESEVSLNEGSYHSSGPKFHTAMPILEDGLSSGHASDLEALSHT